MNDVSRDIFRVQPDLRNFVTMDMHERAIKMMEDKYRYLEARLAMIDRNFPGNNRTHGRRMCFRKFNIYGGGMVKSLLEAKILSQHRHHWPMRRT